MTVAAIGFNSQALWYLTRGFGMVALILLTVTTVLGLAQAVRYARPGLPRFVLAALHRNGSLLAVVAIAIHVITAVLDSYAPIHLIDVFVPYASSYRPFWTGMGALALDLILAVVITSLLRERIGHRLWRGIHWAAYASWPVAVVHGLGTGSDSKLGWVQFLYVACTLAVLAALWWRLARGWSPANSLVRGSALVMSILVSVVVLAWAATGPLKPGWARKAGTPTALLASGAPPRAATSAGTGGGTPAPGGSGAAEPGPVGLSVPFSASLEGKQSQSGPDGSGLVSVVISASFSAGSSATSAQAGNLKLVLTGQPADGGVSLTGSQVTLGSTSDPGQFIGHVSSLQGSTVVATLSDHGGRTVTATLNLEISGRTGSVSGRLEVQ